MTWKGIKAGRIYGPNMVSVEVERGISGTSGYERAYENPIGGEYNGPRIIAEGPILGINSGSQPETTKNPIENIRLEKILRIIREKTNKQ